MEKVWNSSGEWRVSWPERRNKVSDPIKDVLLSAQLVKESACNAGDLGSIPGLGRFPGAGKGYPLQYSGLENSMDCIVHGVAKSWIQRSNVYSIHSLSIKLLGDIIFCLVLFICLLKLLNLHWDIAD